MLAGPPGPLQSTLGAFEVQIYRKYCVNHVMSKNNFGTLTKFIYLVVIKKCADALIWPLWILHRKSFEAGMISSKLKVSRVVPDIADIMNYRITTVSSVVLRVYEIAMKAKLWEHTDPNITNAQHAFRPKLSISSNLLNLSIAAHEAFVKKRQLDVCYGDFANAFDKVIHRILLAKFWKFGIGKKMAKWSIEFLVGRVFFVQIGNVKSRNENLYSDIGCSGRQCFGTDIVSNIHK